MERSSKRGKIPQQDWPSIIKRYEAGETLASIARTYDCSPPAISYILNRSRARGASVEATEQSGIESPELRLVKGHANDMPAKEFTNGAPKVGEAVAVAPPQGSYQTDGSGPEPVSAGLSSAPNEAAGGSELPGRQAWDLEVPAQAVLSETGNTSGTLGTTEPQPQPTEPRRTLHLSLSHSNAEPLKTLQRDGHVADLAVASAVRPAEDQQQGSTQHPVRYHPAPNAAANNGGTGRSMAASHTGRDGGAFIDRALRERVDSDISAFLEAFDAALADDTMESRAGLREATDRLLRAGARTRIELERLEARVPLPPRDTIGYLAPSWRPR